MQRILLAGPGVEPVALAEMEAHLRLDGAAEDDLVGAMVAAARVMVEAEIRRVLIAQSWRALVADWPACWLILPLQPVLSIDAVRAIDPLGAATWLPAEATGFDPDAGAIQLLWRPAGARRFEIDFTAGYGPAPSAVPQPLRHAIRLLVTHSYENRSAVLVGDPSAALPLGYRELIAPYRRITLC